MKDKYKAILIIITGFTVGLFISLLLYKTGPSSKRNKSKIKKVISLAPNVTQTILYLNQRRKLTAVSDFCKIFKKAAELPSAGNNANVNFEKIMFLKPDLIVVQGKNMKVKNFCSNQGIEFLAVNMDSILSIKKGILKIGKALNVKEKAKKFVADMENLIEEFSEKTKNLKTKKVFIVFNRRMHSLSGLFTAGKTSFITKIIEIAGGVNIFKDIKLNYSAVSLESVVRKNPDIIIELSVKGKINKQRKKIMRNHWNDYSMIKAVKNNEIYFLEQTYIQIPGPGIVKTIKLFNTIFSGEYKNE